MNLSHIIKTGLLLLLFSLSVEAQTATVTWNTTYQTIDGFGVSNHDEGFNISTSQADLFFSPTAGNGYSILRIGTPEDGSCTSVSNACANGGDSVSDMQLAQARGARIFASSWTPPGSMKTNGNIACTAGSGNGALSTGSYAAFATYLSNYIKSLSTYYGVTVYALSPSNEPDMCQSYDSTLWTSQNLHDFILNNLGPTFAANGQGSVRIVMPETSGYDLFTNYASTCMNDSACAAFVGVNAFHGYDNSFSISNPYNKGFWETEVSAGPGYGPTNCGGCWDPSIADAMMWANIIDYNIAVANENAWLFWSININDGTDNEGLLGPGGSPVSIRAYVIGNYSKFVRPGWVRIAATHSPVSGVLISAYKDASTGNFAIVAINQNSSSVSQQFNFSGLTAATVTPWTTSASLNLAQQPNVTAGSSFTYTLPAQSVTTFAGATETAPSAINPPSGLKATVQ
jgi:glucuronoarabinoxylan endo-1,4-beta-xylanase